MTAHAGDEQQSAWSDAVLAADLLALDPYAFGGVIVHGMAGPARDAWLARVRIQLDHAAPMLRVPLHTSADRLLGGIDLAATLGTGRRVQEDGVLVRAHGGIAILAMAERWLPAAAALITSVIDAGEVVLERDGFAVRTAAQFGLVALDESMGDETGPPAILVDRLAFRIDLDGVSAGDLADTAPVAMGAAAARARVTAMAPVNSEIVRALCHTALELGVGSLRAPVHALAVARAHAALAGRTAVLAEDAAIAARLVLAPRATCLPADSLEEQDAAPEPPPEQAAENDSARQPDDGLDDAQSGPTPEDIILAAALAAIPQGLLQTLAKGERKASRTGAEGRAGAHRKSVNRGRATGVRLASAARGARLNVLATLRAAAPWQRLRRAAVARHQGLRARIEVRREDFRVNHYKLRTGTTIIFAVDASGSSALHRLTEAKGAVELLLAECYARRDSVALVAFRGTAAEVRLPPSRSLVRAKRSLAGLPGGGGTPMAAGIDAAAELAATARRKGDTPLMVFLTDGRANVSRDGKAGRGEAEKQALEAARAIQLAGLAVVLLDTSPQPHPFARRLAVEMGGRYVPLPVAGAEAISAAVQREMVSSQP